MVVLVVGDKLCLVLMIVLMNGVIELYLVNIVLDGVVVFLMVIFMIWFWLMMWFIVWCMFGLF